jgi:hypothetical protein
LKPRALLFVLFLAGCGANKSSQATSDQPSQLRVRVTNTGDVYGKIGAPTLRNVSPDGDETWVYRYAKADINPASFLTGIGFSDITISDTPYDSQTLTLQFRRQVLLSCKVQLVQGKAAAMTGVSEPSQQSTVEKSCA